MLIKIKNLNKVYRTDEVETTALNNIDLEISAGEFVSIMGPSGCGKSTLLNILGLLDFADSGQYLFENTEVNKLNDRQKAELRKLNIGFVFQSFNLIDELSVFENIELPLIYQHISKKEREEKVNHYLDKMGISHRKKHFPQQLSGGQQQRVAIARAVVSNPKLILADEPTGNLDSVHGTEVMELLTNLNEAGTTIIMVTHSQQDASYSNRIIRLLDGSILSETKSTASVNTI